MHLTTKGNGAEILQRFRAVFARGMTISFPLILFLLAFLPRAIYPVARSTLWHPRALQFIQAVSERDWGATLLAPHPGVTTMWLAGIANRLGSAFIPDFDQQLLHQQMAVELLPLTLVISLAIVLAYFLLSRIFDRQVASVASLLLALDPFHIFISKTLHVDTLMSVFVMISALWMLVYIGQGKQNRWHYMVLSGVFAGLALLSKTPSLFLVPYLLLCLGAWKLSEVLNSRREAEPAAVRWRDGLKATKEVATAVLLWALALVVTYSLLWPSMWVRPLDTLNLTYSETRRYTVSPHPNPLLFMGQTTLDDPGPLFYPVNLSLKTTEIAFLFFFVGLSSLLGRKLDRRRRLALLLAAAFVVFFTAQMTLGQKKAARYELPAFQFVDVVAGVGIVHAVQWLARGRRWLFNLGLFLIIAAQFAVSIPRHPYYGTHYNRIFGSPKAILEKGIVAGQEQGEGLDEAAAYLNGLPKSSLLVVGAQIEGFFSQYFQGKTVPMTDDGYREVDYLVFARNWVVRGKDAWKWKSLWEAYRLRQPKLVVTFDGVPYVWVYKVSPVIDDTTIAHPIHADVGQDFRLLGYDLRPAQALPGETVHLTLYWEAVHKPTGDYTVFTQLLNPMGQMHSQKYNQPQGGMYPTYLWDEGERIQDEYELTIVPDAPPGDYQIAVGMYYLPTLERLSVADRNGALLPDARILIAGPEVPQPSTHPLHVVWGDVILLRRYELQYSTELLELTLYWQAQRRMDVSYKVFVHLVDPMTGAIVVQDDAVPRRWTYPTNWWKRGEVVEDTIPLSLDGVPPGRYHLVLGLYDQGTRERLPAYSADGERYPDDAVLLTTVLH